MRRAMTTGRLLLHTSSPISEHAMPYQKARIISGFLGLVLLFLGGVGTSTAKAQNKSGLDDFSTYWGLINVGLSLGYARYVDTISGLRIDNVPVENDKTRTYGLSLGIDVMFTPSCFWNKRLWVGGSFNVSTGSTRPPYQTREKEFRTHGSLGFQVRYNWLDTTWFSDMFPYASAEVADFSQSFVDYSYNGKPLQISAGGKGVSASIGAQNPSGFYLNLLYQTYKLDKFDVTLRTESNNKATEKSLPIEGLITGWGVQFLVGYRWY